MPQDDDTIQTFTRAAIEWASGGRGQPLVDAAAQALADGLDSPNLRMLAGATRAMADAEADEYAPQTFEELGIEIETRLSSQAIIDGARQHASRFLEGEGTARDLARDIWRMYVSAGYPAELVGFAGLDDYYDMIDHGVIEGREETIGDAVLEAARALVERRPAIPVGVADLSVTRGRPDRGARSWVRRLFDR